jgi:hypothetical protein
MTEIGIMICGMTDAPYEVVQWIAVEVDRDAGDVPIEDAGEAALVPSLVGRRIVEDCVICVVILRKRQVRNRVSFEIS